MNPNFVKFWPWYAHVFAAYPLLYIAASNPGQAEALPVALAVGVALLAATALLVLLRPLLSSWSLAGLGAAWVVFMFYAYGPVNEWWLELVTAGLEQRAAGETWYNTRPQAVHSAIWLLLILWGLDRLRRARWRAAPRMTRGFNLVAGVLVGFLLLQSVSNLATAEDSHAAPALAPQPAAAAGRTLERPDVYFILLDGYARADILREHYDFDNRPFIDGLRRRGFQVSDSSRSNFAWTFLSLGSALNYDYVQPLLGDRLDPDSRSRSDIYRMMRDNRAARFLQERGYRTVHLQSTWGGTGSNPYADQFVPCHTGVFGNEYTRAVADASWLRALASKLSLDVANCHLQNFETLAELAREPGPKFVFAHFLPPHHPYLFDREGRVLRRASISDQFEFQKRLWEDRDSYVDQLVYVNRRIEEVVAHLLEDSSRPPIIVIASDHGPNLRNGLALPEQWRVRFSNLTAMHLPGAPAGYIPADATPVNHFRRIFNFYFGAGFPILPDRYFVSSYLQPFELVELGADNQRLTAAGGL